MKGNLVIITRNYLTSSQRIIGLIINYQPILDQNPFNKIAKIILLLPSGDLWDFALFKDDGFEVISEGG